MRVKIMQDNKGYFYLMKTYFYGLINSTEFLDRDAFRAGKTSNTWIILEYVKAYCAFKTMEDVNESIVMYREKSKGMADNKFNQVESIKL